MPISTATSRYVFAYLTAVFLGELAWYVIPSAQLFIFNIALALSILTVYVSLRNGGTSTVLSFLAALILGPLMNFLCTLLVLGLHGYLGSLFGG